jgi:4-amino-4-deoxy-L-arabinose transferase-like glycosyltransferase
MARLGAFPASNALALWLLLGYGYWVVCTFVLLQIWLGMAVLALPVLRNSCLTGLPALVFSFGVGSYVSSALLLGLGLLGWLHLGGLLVYLLAVLCVVSVGLLARRQGGALGATAGAVSPSAPVNSHRLAAASMILISLWIIPYILLTLVPSTNWDGDTYHLPLARRLLDHGPALTDPYFLQYNFPGAVHLFYAVFLLAGCESAVVAFSFMMGLAVLLTTYILCRHFWGPRAAWLAVLMCAAANVLWEVALTPRIDGTQAFYFLLACLALLIWSQNRNQTGFLLIAGMMLGMALGTKYTGLAFPVVVGLIALVLAWITMQPGQLRLLPPALWAALFVCVPSLFWYGRNWRDLGDPVYPFLTNRLVYRDDVGQPKDLDEASTSLLTRTEPSPADMGRTLRNSPFAFLDGSAVEAPPPPRRQLWNLWDVVRNPDRYSREPGETIPFVLLLFFILPLLCRKKECLVLYAVALFTFLPLATQGHLSRYVLPVVPLFAIGSAVTAERLLARCGRYSRPLGLVLFAVLTWLVAGNCLFEWGKLLAARPGAYFAGKETSFDYLRRVGYQQVDTAYPEAIRWLNDGVDNGLIDKETTVLMIGEPRGYRLHCHYQPDNVWHHGHAWVAELVRSDCNYDRLARNLKDRRVEYILVRASYYEWALRDREMAPSGLRRFKWSIYHLERFLATHATIVHDQGGVRVAKLT